MSSDTVKIIYDIGRFELENEKLKLENEKLKLENEKLKLENDKSDIYKLFMDVGIFKLENEKLKLENEKLKLMTEMNNNQNADERLNSMQTKTTTELNTQQIDIDGLDNAVQKEKKTHKQKFADTFVNLPNKIVADDLASVLASLTVGMDVNEALEAIKAVADASGVTQVLLTPLGALVSYDFRTDRIHVYHKDGKLTHIPRKA
jgi:hypothetical protein